MSDCAAMSDSRRTSGDDSEALLQLLQLEGRPSDVALGPGLPDVAVDQHAHASAAAVGSGLLLLLVLAGLEGAVRAVAAARLAAALQRVHLGLRARLS